MQRQAAKTDSNAKEIDRALERRGASVAKTDGVGRGFPDRVVGVDGENFLLEYKDGSKSPSKQRLNEFQKKRHEKWKGQVAGVKDAAQAISVVFHNKS